MTKDTNPKPFTMDYVLRTTARHMKSNVEVSINKTLSRIKEFEGDQAKSQEVFKTLAQLHTLRRQVEDFLAGIEDNSGQHDSATTN